MMIDKLCVNLTYDAAIKLIKSLNVSIEVIIKATPNKLNSSIITFKLINNSDPYQFPSEYVICTQRELNKPRLFKSLDTAFSLASKLLDLDQNKTIQLKVTKND